MEEKKIAEESDYWYSRWLEQSQEIELQKKQAAKWEEIATAHLELIRYLEAALKRERDKV